MLPLARIDQVRSKNQGEYSTYQRKKQQPTDRDLLSQFDSTFWRLSKSVYSNQIPRLVLTLKKLNLWLYAMKILLRITLTREKKVEMKRCINEERCLNSHYMGVF